jgi:hypothetical protein
VARINQRQDSAVSALAAALLSDPGSTALEPKAMSGVFAARKGHGFSGRLEWCDTHRNFLLAFKGTQLSHLCTKPLIALLGYTSPGPTMITLAFLSLA